MRYMKRNNWTDGPCFYVSIVDGSKFALMAGPFRIHQEALDQVEPARKIGNELDDRAWFYGWGTVKMKNGHKEGKLNEHLNI